MLIDPSTIKYKWFNDRDFEVPLLLGLVEKAKPSILLDVGAHYSWATYAAELKKLVPNYYGVDVIDCPQTKKIIDYWATSNVLDVSYSWSFDFVSCISVIEHCGITTYKVDNPYKEQNNVFVKMCDLASGHLLITCPFGTEGLWKGQYSNITVDQAAAWTGIADARGFKVEKQFLFNEFPQGQKKWFTISENEAAKVPLDTTKGVQCNMIFYAYREQT